MENSKITTPEAISIILGVFATHTLVALPRSLIDFTKSGTLVNIIYVGIIAFFIAVLIYKLIKNFPGSDIIDIAEYIGGKNFKTILGIIFIFFFISTASILLRNFCECLKIVYYPMTHVIFIILCFVIAICVGSMRKFSSITKINLIIIPLVALSMLFLFVANYRNFSFDNVFPIIGTGFYDTFVAGILNIGAFGGITLLYFIPPYLKEPEKMKKVFTTSILLGTIYLLFSVAIILLMFISLIYTNQIMPLYSAARYIEFGTFFQRLEALFILIWALQMLCYLTILSKISISIFKKITNIEDDRPLTLVFSLLIFAISIFPKNYAISKFIEEQAYKYMVIIISILLGLSILIIGYFKKRKKKELLSYE